MRHLVPLGIIFNVKISRSSSVFILGSGVPEGRHTHYARMGYREVGCDPVDRYHLVNGDVGSVNGGQLPLGRYDENAQGQTRDDSP